jgi:hypothetical protein
MVDGKSRRLAKVFFRNILIGAPRAKRAGTMVWASRREKNAPANISKGSGSIFKVVHGKTALAKMFEPSGLPVSLDPGPSFAATTAGLAIISFKTNRNSSIPYIGNS